MQHGWLGDDSWFERNNRDKTKFRSAEKIENIAKLLRANHIQDVYPHLCPCLPTGEIAASNKEQVELFLDGFKGIRVLPWVGGMRDSDALIDNASWRSTFASSCAKLLEDHPRLAGIHINIEPMPSGDKNYLLVLEEVRSKLPRGKILSIAAYPPPTFIHQFPQVHWDENYCREISARVDQVCVMMYDTSARLPRLYEQIMRDWTVEVLSWYKGNEVLLGVPCYRDENKWYHDMNSENIMHALRGIHGGLKNPLQSNYKGVCIYCEWEMTPEKWQTFRQEFLSSP